MRGKWWMRTFVEALKQCDTRKENKKIKDGEVAELAGKDDARQDFFADSAYVGANVEETME